MGFCNRSMFCCALLCVHSSFAIISMGKRKLVALLSLSSWCLVIVVSLFLTMPRVCLQFFIVVFPDHTHLLFLVYRAYKIYCICANSCNVNVRPWADPEGVGGRTPTKITSGFRLPRNSGTDLSSLKSQMDHLGPLIPFGLIASRGRFARPFEEYVDDYK